MFRVNVMEAPKDVGHEQGRARPWRMALVLPARMAVLDPDGSSPSPAHITTSALRARSSQPARGSCYNE